MIRVGAYRLTEAERSAFVTRSRKLYDAEIDALPFKKADRASLKAGFADGIAHALRELIAVGAITVIP